MRHAITVWFVRRPIIFKFQLYEVLSKPYKDEINWKVLYEKEKILTEEAREEEEKKKKLTKSKAAKEEEMVKRALYSAVRQEVAVEDEETTNIKNAFSQMLQTRAQVAVIKHEFEVMLINHANEYLSNEHSSLLGCFEMGGAERQVCAFVHPAQQFAATPFHKVDKNSHLDIITKVSFVQQFLSKLRNRCTEVETLTSGPGVVFSLKDFNECLQTFC